MSRFKVIVRRDLNMPNGNLFAQVSHGLMKVVTSVLVRDNENNLKISKEDSEKLEIWRNTGFDYDIAYLSDEDYYASLEMAANNKKTTVFDNGLTCFDNNFTETCSVIFPEWLTSNKNHIISTSTSQVTDERQSILLSNKPKRSAETMLREATICAIESIFIAMSKTEFGEYQIRAKEEKHLHNWILGSYGKIVLGTSTKEKVIMSLSISEVQGVTNSCLRDENNRVLCVAFSPVDKNTYLKINSGYRPLN